MLEGTIRHGTILAVGVLIVCMFGILAVLRVPVQMIPDLEIRTVSVRTSWPGATPQDVEKEILVEQEEYLRGIPSVQRLVSTATFGQARIELEFPFGVDLNDALIRVNNALSQVPSYPENVDEPRLYTTSFSNNSFMFFRVEPAPGNPRGLDMNMLRDYVDDNVRTRLERVPGVSEVSVWGGAERQVQIFVDPAKLAERGIALTELRDRLRERNRDISGGDLDAGKRRYLLRTVGRFQDLDELGDIVIARRGETLVRLRDVAEVRLHHFEIRSSIQVNGVPVINVSIKRETGSNVIAIKERVMKAVAEANRDVLEPMGMRMALITDDVRYVEDAVRNVWQNLAIGAALATAVMYLFLRSVPATLIGVAGIPICTIAAFLGLLFAGRTINVVSLAGVAFAIGMTLDNSIVVLESIERELARGRSRMEAAIIGVRRVWTAVLASTLTTILVFLPVLFVREEAGQLYSDIAVALSASVFVSMLVAVTVVPAAFANFRIREARTRPGLGAALAGGIVASAAWLIGNWRRRLLCLVSLGAITWFAIARLTPPAEYLPEGEEPKSFSLMFPPPGYNFQEMSQAAERVNRMLLPHVGGDPDRYDRGETPVPALEYIVTWVNPDQVRIVAEPIRKTPAHIDGVMNAVTGAFDREPGMRSFSSRGSIFASNYGGTRSINVDISGVDLEAIYRTASTAFERTKEIFVEPRIKPDPPALSLAQPLLELRPRWERAAELGMSAEDIGYTVAALTDGAYVDEVFVNDDKIDLFIYSTQGTSADPSSIRDLPVYTPDGAVVPVSALAELRETADTETLRRVDGRRTVTLSIIPPRQVPLEAAVSRVENELIGHMKASGKVPAGVNMEISGASDQLQATREALTGNFIVAVLLCYLLLVAIFSHWGYPFVIMTTVPLGIAGGIGGLWLLNVAGAWLPAIGLPPFSQAFDMITMLGFLILVGTVVNNPILIVDRALAAMREEGAGPREAVRDAVEVRLRPIMMSTITTVVGLAPLVFIPGAGTELYRGLGAIVMFGLIFATIVTLTFLPALLTFVLELRARLVAARNGRVQMGSE